MPISFMALTVTAAAAARPGCYTLVVGGAPGLLVCECELGDGCAQLRPCRSFRPAGGPMCCSTFDRTGEWLACASMNGMLTLIRRAPLVGQGEEQQQPFSSRLPVSFGIMAKGTRPTGLEWSPHGLRLLVGCWDGCVEMLEGGVGASVVGGGDAPRWRLRTIRPPDGPIEARCCAPQLTWLPSGLAFAVTRQLRTPQRVLHEASRAELELVASPPPQLCALGESTLLRESLDEAVAGLACLCAPPAGAAASGASPLPDVRLLLVALSGAVRALALPAVAVLDVPWVQRLCLCRTGAEQVTLWQGAGESAGRGCQPGVWQLRVAADGAADSPELHPLSFVNLAWVEVAEAAAHALAQPADGAAERGCGLRIGLNARVLLLARANALYWRSRVAARDDALGGQQAKQPQPQQQQQPQQLQAEDGWQMFVTGGRILACCACADGGEFAVLLGQAGGLSVWCLREARLLLQLPASLLRHPARACVSLCARVDFEGGREEGSGEGREEGGGGGRERRGGRFGVGGRGEGREGEGGGGQLRLRAVLIEFECGGGGDGVAESDDGGARAETDGGALRLLHVRSISARADGTVEADAWRRQRVPHACTPGRLLGLQAGGAVAFAGGTDICDADAGRAASSP
ncbi:hypothetical protein T492DRAFT_1021786 [Pavlovales sp. CCMP2436]|nr:hypothetical protein T492DRAFT_1021786 [Pavlovales sp. CCMP2436]